MHTPLLALLLTACAPEADLPVGAAAPPGLVTPVAGDPPTTHVIAREDYVIRLGQRGACPVPSTGGWTVEPMFDASLHAGPAADDELGRYCVYSDPTAAAGPPFAGLPESDGEVQDLSPILAIAGSAGIPGRLLTGPSSVDPAVLADLHIDRFRASAGLPIPRSGAAAPPVVPARKQARLVLIDTVDRSTRPFPYDIDLFQNPMSHGLALAVAAQQLTCPNLARCPVQIATVDAVSRTTVHGHGNAPTGQSWGTPTDLAQAIYRATKEWKSDKAHGRVGPLVLNLSVAWHPWFGGGLDGGYEVGADGAQVDVAGDTTATFAWQDVDPATWPTDVRAVYAALHFARCEGAMIFAAAGNSTGGPHGEAGPMLPAAWEALPPAMLGACANGPMPEPNQPLLHAVGAVDAAGDDLSVSRPDSRPKLLAYGDHFGFDPALTLVTEPTQALTGTSVSTLVVSATAAIVASRHPRPTTTNVVHVLLATGDIGAPIAPWAVDVSTRVDATLTSGGQAGARVVRVCAPLNGRGYSCPPTAPLLEGFGESDDPPLAELSWATPDDTVAGCDGWTVHREAIAGDVPAYNPCPQLTRWSPDISPWVLPQPPTEGCSSCFIDLAHRRFGLNATNVAGWTDLTLLVQRPTGRLAYSVPAPPAGATSVVWSWTTGALPADALTVSLTGVKDERSQRVPMPIVGR